MNRLPQNDIERIFRHTKDLWEELRRSNIFITGGTGFFGKWLLESFLAANDKFKLKASIAVLSRNPEKFEQEAPHLAGHPAVRLIKGDGTPRRSYLYAADLAIWLWTILVRGKNMQAFNVGSENSLSLAETAELVAKLSENKPKVIIDHKPERSMPVNVYVPDTRRARTELGLKETISLREAVQRTINFYRSVIPD